MTKAEIVEMNTSENGLHQKDFFELVEQVFELMKDTLSGGENLKLSGFGNFVVKKKADRRGRNPADREENHY